MWPIMKIHMVPFLSDHQMLLWHVRDVTVHAELEGGVLCVTHIPKLTSQFLSMNLHCFSWSSPEGCF